MPRLLFLLLLALPLVSADRYAQWQWFDTAAIPVLKEAGITHLLVASAPPAEFTAAAEKAGIKVETRAATIAGHWPRLDPHVQTGPGEGATAAATGEAWIDSNGFLILYHRAMATGKPVLLSYDPPKDARLRPGSFELAVADATVFGGQAVLKLDERMRAGLAAAQPRVLAEWKRIARQFQFAEQEAFRGQPAANIAVVADKLDPVGEVLNLLARRNLPFQVVAPSAKLDGFAAVISIGRPPLRVKGPLLIERKEVGDPSAFANEVRTLMGDRRLYALANAETIISHPLRLADGRLAVHLINYAIDPVQDVRLRLMAAGKFSRAQLLAPEKQEPAELKVTSGEVAVPEVRISAVVVLVQ